MSLVAELRLDSPVLREALLAVPEMRLRALQETLPRDDPPRLIFRAGDGDFEAFEAAMGDDPSVTTAVCLNCSDERRLYRATVAAETAGRMTYGDAVGLDVLLLGATGTADGWVVRMQFPDRDALGAYCEACERCGVAFDVRQLYTDPESDRGDGTRLTDVQRETLELALDRGYFEVPRNVSMQELAEELGVSGQAVSERLRRGLREATTAALRDGDGSSGRT